ncbi:class I SAM-dependent methyltransferase [Sulfitobacter geojensis]|uniref:class I SAM-dependent methyltransferase n=1 Tax=Sulfitobacter geojensis TaxID=1342299 RepID=UPI000468A4BA|nr:class I SAM-dependent methyltransferase [Sulfitobacter geojensis]KHA53364.1 Methyltransferase [Sulfitobacter geojensis]NYI27985.1 ubiquinone/menaquinone biosynthesis C-methylase UbiE [Sulfitobacter geojensis]
MERVSDPANQTRDVYDRQASTFDAQRSKSLFEARWLARFTACLPPGGRVLDVGCGSGDPIARWFIAEGFSVTGTDFSPPMLDILRDRWPSGDWRLADMRSLELGECFDGLIAWNSFFHLTQDEQRVVLPRFARHLKTGGTLLVTVGPREGETTGTVGGETVYHASLSPAEYATALENCGLRLTGFLAEDPETQQHSVLMAHKDKDI